MPFGLTRELVVRLGRLTLIVEGVALIAAAILGVIFSFATNTPLLKSFQFMVFVPFVLLLLYGVLSGPGMFLSRPKFAPIGPEARSRWRRWLQTPPVGTDQEFFELVLYTGLAFLLVGIATVIGLVLGG